MFSVQPKKREKSWLTRNVFTILIYALSFAMSFFFLILILVFRLFDLGYYYETFLFTWVIADALMWFLVEKVHHTFYRDFTKSQRTAFRFSYFMAGIVGGGILSAFLNQYFYNLQGYPFFLFFVVSGVCFGPLAVFYFQRRYVESSGECQREEEGEGYY